MNAQNKDSTQKPEISDFFKSGRLDYSNIERKLVLEQSSYMEDIARSNANLLEDTEFKEEYNYWASMSDILQEFNEYINTGYREKPEIEKARMRGMLDAMNFLISAGVSGDFSKDEVFR